MERKLVKQGHNALTVTLPAKWLQDKGLKAGDSVSIEQDNKSLVINPGKITKKIFTELNVENLEINLTYHILFGKYIEGYDEIIIKHNNPNLIQDITNKMLGMILEYHSNNKSIIKNIIQVPEENFDKVLKRATHILSQLGKTVYGVSLGNESLEDVKNTESLLDFNLLYCLRYLNKYEASSKAYKNFLICSTLESAGDQLWQISKRIKKDKELGKLIAKTIENYSKLLLTNEYEKMYKLLRNFRKNIDGNKFVDGLTFSLAENLYNYLGYISNK